MGGTVEVRFGGWEDGGVSKRDATEDAESFLTRRGIYEAPVTAVNIWKDGKGQKGLAES